MAQNLQQVGGNVWQGADATQEATGKVFHGCTFIDSRRYRDADRRQQYYDCTQHNQKRFDFDGRILMVGTTELAYTQPLLSSEKAGFYVPLRARRPSAPYRLSRAIVNAFTNFVLGEGRFPTIRVPGDDDSQDFMQTCGKVGHLPSKMIAARNLGGAVGTVGMSYAYVGGKPRFKVHNGKNLFVQEWQDREELIPKHVTECYQVTQEEWDPEKKAVVEVPYWYRRDWTMQAELVFELVRAEEGEEPDWEAALNLERSVLHKDNDPHFVWIQNVPVDGQIDGLPDCEGQYESLDELDVMLSVMVRGAKLNLDPTLVLKEDLLRLQRMGVRKGSDNAIVVDKDGGDAKYLELAGTSIEAGIKLFNEHRKTILEATECVIPNPDEIAAQGQSAAAQKMVFSRMLSKGGIIQEQYGAAMERLLEPLLYIAQARVQNPVQVATEDGQLVDVDQSFSLPPRITQKPVMGDDGQPTGEHEPEITERHPGEGSGVELEWPPRFPPTPQDQQSIVTTLTTAVPNKPIMSQQTAVELAMGAFGRDPTDEWKKVQSETKQDEQKQKEQLQQQAGAFAHEGAGGATSPMHAPKGPKAAGGAGGGGKGGGDDDDEEPPAEPPAD
jgi:hypothetical protein